MIISWDAPGFIPWTSYQIRRIAGCAYAGNTGNIFHHHRLQRKPLVSDPGMHHGTCVTHVPWCMSGSLVGKRSRHSRRIRNHTMLRIWQEAHSSLPEVIHNMTELQSAILHRFHQKIVRKIWSIVLVYTSALWTSSPVTWSRKRKRWLSR